MDKNYFCFLLEWAEMFKLLTEEQCGQLIMAMIAYEKNGTEPDFSDDILLPWFKTMCSVFILINTSP